MPANRSAFPRGKRRQLWETVVKMLREDGTLKRCVQTWYVLDGTDRTVKEDWTLGALPGLAVSLQGRPSEWFADRDFRAPILFNFELAIASTAEPDLLDFWECVESSIFPPSQPHGPLAALRGIVQGCSVIGCGVAPKLICGGKALATEGQILFNFHRYT